MRGGQFGSLRPIFISLSRACVCAAAPPLPPFAPGKVDAVEAQLGRASLAGTDDLLRQEISRMKDESEAYHREITRLEAQKLEHEREIRKRQVRRASVALRVRVPARATRRTISCSCMSV